MMSTALPLRRVRGRVGAGAWPSCSIRGMTRLRAASGGVRGRMMMMSSGFLLMS
jgi:hypothetical protein